MHGDNGVAYNISAEGCNVRLKDFASLCAEWAGKNVVFELPNKTEQKGYSLAQRAVLDNYHLRNLGWRSAYEMNDAVCRTLDIMRKNYS